MIPIFFPSLFYYYFLILYSYFSYDSFILFYFFFPLVLLFQDLSVSCSCYNTQFFFPFGHLPPLLSPSSTPPWPRLSLSVLFHLLLFLAFTFSFSEKLSFLFPPSSTPACSTICYFSSLSFHPHNSHSSSLPLLSHHLLLFLSLLSLPLSFNCLFLFVCLFGLVWFRLGWVFVMASFHFFSFHNSINYWPLLLYLHSLRESKEAKYKFLNMKPFKVLELYECLSW